MLVLTHSQSSILSCWSISDTICKSQNLRICFLTLLNHVAHTMAKYSLGVINRPYGCNMYLSSQVLQESLEDRLCCLFFFLCLMNLEFSKIKKKKKKKKKKVDKVLHILLSPVEIQHLIFKNNLFSSPSQFLGNQYFKSKN